MNIGAWPIEKEELTNSHVQYREKLLSKENNKLFWTKSFLQTSSYDDKRYREIASNACQRIVHEESKTSSSRLTPCRPSSIIAVSLSETSTRHSSSNNHSTPQTITLPINSKKKSSSTRFSCYLKSHNTKPHSKQIKKKLPTTILPKNNNHSYDKNKLLTTKKNFIKLNNQYREKLCQKCLKIIRTSSTYVSSNVLCQSCLDFIRNSNNIISIKRIGLNKTEENELRQIIAIVIEEFQDHFGQALNLSIKQMTQHLLSNINLFYNHYQQEFEQLTKKYRLAFLERFIQLMNKFQTCQLKTNNINQQIKSSISGRNSITHPPDILSMSSLSDSLATEKDRSETIAQLITPTNSISLSTTSNRSIIINKKKNSNSSSKKTFTLNGTAQRQSFQKSGKQTSSSSSLKLIDAYRFRETLRINHTHFSSPRPKIR